MAQTVTLRPSQPFRNASPRAGYRRVQLHHLVTDVPIATANDLVALGSARAQLVTAPRGFADRPSVMSAFASDTTALAFARLSRLGYLRETLSSALAASTSRYQLRVGLRALAPRLQTLSRTGARVILECSRTPAWLSSSSDTATIAASGWKVQETYPPADFSIYRRMMADCADLLRREFGLAGLYWEFWNEPAVTGNSAHPFWRGTQFELFHLYAAFALGVREGDPSAKVGSMSFSPWNAASDDGPTKPLAKAFFEFAVAPPKDVNGGLPLPLDFITWHIFHARPEDTWIAGQLLREYLESAGIDPGLPQIVTEWNLGSTLTNGDATADGEIGAAHVASAIYEADRLGIDGHTFAALVDFTAVSAPNLFVGGQGLYTNTPDVKKAKAHVFEMLSRMAGERIGVDLSADTDAHGIGAIASKNGRNAYVLLFRYAPDVLGETNSALYANGILSFVEYLTTAELSTYLSGGALPSWVPSSAVSAFAAAKSAGVVASTSPSTVDVQFSTAEIGTPTAYRIYRINTGSTNNPRAAFIAAGGTGNYAPALAAAQAQGTLTANTTGSGALPQLTLGAYEVVLMEADF